MQSIRIFPARNSQITLRVLNQYGDKHCISLNSLKKISTSSCQHNDDVNRDKGYDRTSNISESHKKFASFFDPLQNLAEKNRLFDFKTYSIADWSSISTMFLFSVLLILFVWIDVKGDLVGQYDKNSIPVKKPEVSDTKTEQQQQK